MESSEGRDLCLDSNFVFSRCVLSSRPLTNLHLFPLCRIIYVDVVGVEPPVAALPGSQIWALCSSAHLEEERSGRADERVVLTSERLKRLLAVRKLDRLEEHGLSPPPWKKSLPAPKHRATRDFLGGGGCFLHFCPVS